MKATKQGSKKATKEGKEIAIKPVLTEANAIDGIALMRKPTAEWETISASAFHEILAIFIW